MPEPKYDTTLARVVGNILSGVVIYQPYNQAEEDKQVAWAVRIAKKVVAEIRKGEA